jgi:quercetin dioxygenase-like cupin family protein
MRMIFLPAAALFLAGAAPEPQAFDPDRIAWQRTNPDGTRFALLEGVRDRPGVPFSYAFFIPAGGADAAHSHAATARVFVARGTLWLGYGDRLDRRKTRKYPAGSYLVVPAGARHFDGADVDTIIIGTATGPWSTDYVDKAAPASAGSPH